MVNVEPDSDLKSNILQRKEKRPSLVGVGESLGERGVVGFKAGCRECVLRLAESHPSLKEPKPLFTERNWKPKTQNLRSTVPWGYNDMSDHQCPSMLGACRPVRGRVRGLLPLQLPQHAASVSGSVKAWGWRE